MKYKLQLSLEEKSTIQACLMLAEQKLMIQDVDNMLKDVRKVIKKLDNIEPILEFHPQVSRDTL